MHLSRKAIMFRSDEGQVFIRFSTRGLLFSPDGQQFFELHVLREKSTKYILHFEDPHHGKTGELQENGDTLELGKVVFDKMDSCPTEIEVVPLPDDRKPRNLFRLKDGQFVYISAAKYNELDDSLYKLYVGHGGDGKYLREVTIRRWHRYRGYSDVLIYTDEEQGELFISKDGEAAWEEGDLIKLDPSQFHISETEEGVQISERDL